MLVYHSRIRKRNLVEMIPIWAPWLFSVFSTVSVSGKKNVLTVMYVSASFTYSFLYSANVSGVVIPLKILNESSSVFPMVRFMASSLMPVCPWRSSTLRKQITMPREESASV